MLAVRNGLLPNPFDQHPKSAQVAPGREPSAPTAKVIRPKAAASVPITVDQLAVVEPYYRADLRARASGLVKAVRYDIGSRVKKGEVLVEIEVPELEQGVAVAAAW